MPAQIKAETSEHFEERVNLLKPKLRLLNPMSHVGSQTMFHSLSHRYNMGSKIAVIYAIFGRVRRLQNWLHHVCRSVRPSAWKNSDPSERVYMEVYI